MSIANEAIAASVAVSALIGNDQQDLPPELVVWLHKQDILQTDQDYLVQLSLSAITKVKTHSKLQKWWDSSDNKEAWHQALSKLEVSLKSEKVTQETNLSQKYAQHTQ